MFKWGIYLLSGNFHEDIPLPGEVQNKLMEWGTHGYQGTQLSKQTQFEWIAKMYQDSIKIKHIQKPLAKLILRSPFSAPRQHGSWW